MLVVITCFPVQLFEHFHLPRVPVQTEEWITSTWHGHLAGDSVHNVPMASTSVIVSGQHSPNHIPNPSS